MFTAASTFARAGVIALGVLTGFGGTAMTAPLGPIDISAPAARSNFPIEPVRARVLRRGGGAWRGGGPGWRGRNWDGNRAWRGNRNWRGNGNWNKGRSWNGGRGYYKRYHDYDDDDFGIVLGLGLPLLGLGLPLLGGYGGYYPGYYNGYYPGYYNGGYYPRRYYRTGNGHERWCYARYRSYRAWDNTYQPYNGPRRQCNSPYG
jgi:BA14K-like protein